MTWRWGKNLIILGMTLGLAHCGPYQYDQFPAPSINPPWLANPKIEAFQETVVPPAFTNFMHYRLGILLFHTPHDIPEESYHITRIFYRSLLERGLFKEVVFIPVTYYETEHALRESRKYNVDLLLLGEVPYFLDSGTVGRSGLQVDLKLVEVKTRHILWYLTDAISATPKPIIDLIVTETRPKPTPSVYTLADRLADRMLGNLGGEPQVTSQQDKNKQNLPGINWQKVQVGPEG